MDATGFALDEYIAPFHGPLPKVRGGTMGKATYVPGGFNDNRRDVKEPGPGQYSQTEEKFYKVKGGTFSRLDRSQSKKREGGPSVGQYNVDNDTNAGIMLSTGRVKVRGGIMTKRDRICAFARLAEASNAKFSQKEVNGPGKYNPEPPTKQIPAPKFGDVNRSKAEQKAKDRISGVGPGHYTPIYKQIDLTVPGYYHAKHTDNQTYMAKLSKDRNSGTPFPCYKDMPKNLWAVWPESDKFDKTGIRKHCKKLLNDRKVMNGRRNNSSAAARSRRYSATPEPFSLREFGETPRPASEIPRGTSYTPRPTSETPRPDNETPRPASVTPRLPKDTPRPYTPRDAGLVTPRPASSAL
jgi:hypothetical protein